MISIMKHEDDDDEDDDNDANGDNPDQIVLYTQHYFVSKKSQLLLKNIRISLTSVAMPTKWERPFRPKSL